MSGGETGKLKLTNLKPNAIGALSAEEKTAAKLFLEENKKRIKELERNISDIEKINASTVKTPPTKKPPSHGQALHAAHAEGWLALSTEADLCRVGKDIVAFNSFATLDRKICASENVKARGTSVYRKGDIIANVQANAGAHIISGTSLASGHVVISEGHQNVKANNIPMARHNSRCRINTDANGNGGCAGKIVTLQKNISGTNLPDAKNDNGAPRKQTSELLEKLEAKKKEIEDRRLNLNALDEYVNFKDSHAILDEAIGTIKADPGTLADYGAQVARGGLGFVKDVGMGVGELAYEGIKAVPKYIRSQVTLAGQTLTALNGQIFAENIRLGNISAGTVGSSIADIGGAIVKPVVSPWKKGQYVESVTRGAVELGTVAFGWIKAIRVSKAAQAAEALEKAKTVEAAADAARVSEAAAETARVAEASASSARLAEGARSAELGDASSRGAAAAVNEVPVVSNNASEGVYVAAQTKRVETIAERIARGEKVPQWARDNPDSYQYDLDSKRYQRIPEAVPDLSVGANERRIPCFAAGTLVLMPAGFARIEDINVGDVVVSWDENSHRMHNNRVTALHKNYAVEWVEINLPNYQISSTRHHRFRVESMNEWIEAQHLIRGMELVTSDNKHIVVESIVVSTTEVTGTYNLTVENAHTYFVGDEKILVHNSGSTPDGKVYVGVNASGEPIYVGQTLQRLDIREAQHRADALLEPEKYGWKADMKLELQPGMDGLTSDQMDFHERRIYTELKDAGADLKNRQIPLTDSKVNALLEEYC